MQDSCIIKLKKPTRCSITPERYNRTQRNKWKCYNCSQLPSRVQRMTSTCLWWNNWTRALGQHELLNHSLFACQCLRHDILKCTSKNFRCNPSVLAYREEKINCPTQCFSTFSLKGAKSRLTSLLEGRTETILKQVNWDVVFPCITKSVTQNIRVDERLLREKVLASRMRFSEEWLRTLV